MNDESSSPEASLPVAVLERIDRVCLDFEAAWKEGRSPRIEEYLGETQGPERSRLLRELVLLELDYRARQGEQAIAEEYEGRFAEDASVIRDAFQYAATDAGGGGATPRAGLPIPRPRPLPSELGDYELLDVLGDGGMGIVYRARQRRADRIVALKVIRPDRLAAVFPQQREEAIERMRGEALAAAKLEHDHIVPVFEVGEVEGEPFFSMRYIEGRRLDEVLRDGPLEGREAAALVEPVARAVHYAHEHGIIHRDLKPRNILLDSARRPYVADFGLAKSPEAAQHLTQTGQAIGTLPYMSPQQAQGEAVGRAGDVYSLGATLYELLTGRPPFRAATLAETQRQVIENEPVPPRRLNPAVDRDLETICLKCLEKEPRNRYRSAAELADELVRYQRDVPIQARPITRAARFWRWCKRNRAVASLGAVAAALLLALAIGGPLAAVRQNRLRRQAEGLLQEKTELLGERDSALATAEARRVDAERNYHLVLDTVHELMTIVGSHTLADTPRMQRTRQELLEKALATYQQLLAERGQDETLLARMLAAYESLARVCAGLGLKEEAEHCYCKTIAICKKLVQEFPDQPTYQCSLVHGHAGLANLLRSTREYDVAEGEFEEAIRVGRHLIDQFGDDPRHREKAIPSCRFELVGAYDQLGVLYTVTGRHAEADQAFRAGIEQGEMLVVNWPDEAPGRIALANCYADSATPLLSCPLDRSRLPEAERRMRLASRHYALIQGKDHETILRDSRAGNHANLAGLLCATDRLPEAIEELNKAGPLWQKNLEEYPEKPIHWAHMGNGLALRARLLLRLGRPEECEPLLHSAIGFQVKALEMDAGNQYYLNMLIGHWMQLGDTLERRARNSPEQQRLPCYLRAFRSYATAVSLKVRYPELGPGPVEQSDQDELGRAKRCINDAIDRIRTPEDRYLVARALVSCPVSQLRDPATALRLADRAVKDATTEKDRILYRQTLGAAQYRAGDDQKAINTLKETTPEADPGNPFAILFLAMAHCRSGNRTHAEKLLRHMADAQADSQMSEEIKHLHREAQTLIADSGQSK